MKFKELQYNVDSIHAILTNFTRNYGEIILHAVLSLSSNSLIGDGSFSRIYCKVAVPIIFNLWGTCVQKEEMQMCNDYTFIIMAVRLTDTVPYFSPCSYYPPCNKEECKWQLLYCKVQHAQGETGNNERFSTPAVHIILGSWHLESSAETKILKKLTMGFLNLLNIKTFSSSKRLLNGGCGRRGWGWGRHLETAAKNLSPEQR